MHRDDDEHERGLRHDLPRLLATGRNRRDVLMWLAASGATTALAACSSGGDNGIVTGTGTNGSGSTGSGSTGSGISTNGECVLPASETAGPYPGDGSNTRAGSVVNVLDQSGVVRSDIRESFGSQSGVAEGVPLTLTIQLLDVNNLCAPLEGYVVYLWHCTADGEYSLYSTTLGNENFLRGVQAADANGELTFTTVFPGCYSGRYPHIHFEVYPSLDMATLFSNRVLTSQIALPESVCDIVYASSDYAQSATNFSRTSIASDNVFGDNSAAQMAVMTPTLSGDNVVGYEGSLIIGVPGI